MFLDKFHVPHTRYPLQIIHYDGPPKPKQPSQRTPFKSLINEDQSIYNAERENEGDIAPTSDGVELNDFTYLAEEGNCELSGSTDGASGDVGRNANIVEDSHSDSEADEGDPYNSDSGLHTSDRLEGPNPESCGREFFTGTNNAITSETGDGAKTEASEGLHWRSPSMPPTSPSMRSVKQWVREASHSVPTQATTHQPQHPTEKRAEREVHLPTSKSTSSSSSSGSDTNDDDDSGNHITPLIHKRKRTLPAYSASYKRQSRIPDIHSARRQKPFPSRKRPFSSRLTNTRLASGAQSSSCDIKMRYGENSSGESSGGSDNRSRHRRKGPNSMASEQASVSCSSRSNAENSSFNLAPSHANWRTKRSAEYISPGKTQWRLTDIAFHSLPADVSFVTTLFRAGTGVGILSPSYAVKLLENAVGQAIKLEDVTIKLLTPDTWFLTSFVDYASDVAGLETDQPVSALSSLRLNRADVAPARQHGRPSDDIDNETSSDDYEINGKENDGHSSDIVDEPSSSRKHSRWSEEDDNRLRI
ncbi:hypothetical protein AA0121_g12780 [Alternaria tenuissima]|nr:hypothetical protein AA0121_g12780 [Alternaria tenuissima]